MPTTAQLPEAASVPAILLLGTQFINEFVLSIQEVAYPGSGSISVNVRCVLLLWIRPTVCAEE